MSTFNACRRPSRMRNILALVVATPLMWAAGSFYPSHAAEGTVAIPQRAALYRHRVEQASARVFGVNANPARLAAQLHQESAWRPKAQSKFAHGIAQFTPSTAKWMAKIFPKELSAFDPFEPQQAIMAAALYDKWLYDRTAPIGGGALHDCDRWHFTLRAYNGGLGWINRERKLAANRGYNANRWYAVEPHRLRARWAHKENTDYSRRILHLIEPAYLNAGWAGGLTCD